MELFLAGLVVGYILRAIHVYLIKRNWFKKESKLEDLERRR